MPRRGLDNSPIETGPDLSEQAQFRKQAMNALIADVMQRRARGESLPDAEVIDAHRELMPELAGKLAVLNRVCRAFWEAEKIGLEGSSQATHGTVEYKAKSLSMKPEDNRPGERAAILAYTIVQEIDSGGQGTVFRAIQRSTGRVVAIKIISGGPLLGSRRRVRFEREAEFLARLRHPNIVGIVDRGRMADGSLFMAMDLIEGPALDEHVAQLRAQGHAGLRGIVRLFITIARAVHDVHQHGIVHRDLKPSNIRIDSRGQPHVLDFGLARLAAGLPGEDTAALPVTLTGQIVGSLPWASPEHVCGDPERPDVRSDVYALGVMLYQALTGTFPYPVTGALSEVIDRIQRAAPVPPSRVRRASDPSIPVLLDTIVLKTLAKLPQRRHASAEQLAAELEACLAGRWYVPSRSLRLFQRWSTVACTLTCLAACWAVFFPIRPHRPIARPTTVAVIPLPVTSNALGMRFVRIPAGEFLMGSPINEPGRNRNENLHPISVSANWLATTEVTQQQYRMVMDQLPCEQPWPGDHLPVQGVRWAEAMAFCKRLGEQDGRHYRLPSEAEWEYACRAGTTTPFAGTGRLDNMGWFAGNSGGHPHPGAGKSPNHWGLYDMHGNVQEWCVDPYQPTHQADDGTADPQEPTITVYHVLRGGGSHQPEQECRSASRNAHGWQARPVDVGFRVVLVDKTPPT